MLHQRDLKEIGLQQQNAVEKCQQVLPAQATINPDRRGRASSRTGGLVGNGALSEKKERMRQKQRGQEQGERQRDNKPAVSAQLDPGLGTATIAVKIMVLFSKIRQKN